MSIASREHCTTKASNVAIKKAVPSIEATTTHLQCSALILRGIIAYERAANDVDFTACDQKRRRQIGTEHAGMQGDTTAGDRDSRQEFTIDEL